MHFDSTVTLSVICSIVIAIIGWVINAINTRAINKKAKDDANAAAERRSKDLDDMRDQINALQDQAKTLKAQFDLETKRESVPRWKLSHNKGVIYSISNLNSYDAKNVTITSSMEVHRIGDISAGSQATVYLTETSIFGENDQVDIAWTNSEGEEKSSRVAIPPRP